MRERMKRAAQTFADHYGFSVSLAVLAIVLIVGFAVKAQTTGYRFAQNGIVFAGNGSVCFESAYNAGPDVCIERSAAGHVSVTSGSLGTDGDMYGQVALSGGTKTITFAQAYTVAPIAVCTDTAATATVVGCHTTASTLVINGTGTDTINYEIIPNPN